MIRHKLKPIIVVLNNDGYTTERLIHGEDMEYNDIQPWKYAKFLKAFGAKKGEYKSYVVKTGAEFHDLFMPGNEFSKANVIQLVEIVMPRKDAPHGLVHTVQMMRNFNKKL
ncbi:Pyruvate decarboxylase 1 [Orbilia brochopaga]|uniref:Pyruvate decarboxylase 1 n=1 Tax=Orbilia brochopaga TaxID=3140254 RepID=A0AAV9UHQ6_9PEZI